MSFRIDPRLEADGAPLAELPLCHVRLVRDARFPWIVAVPRVAGAEELTDLSPADRAALVEELALLTGALKAATGAYKINVGALGNIVRQLHIHIVARFEGDAAWPGPVWGSGATMPYLDSAMESLAKHLRRTLAERISVCQQ